MGTNLAFVLYKFVSPNRTNTTELPRKPAGVFFRWETPREPIAVHFHLNVVDLLDGDFIRRGETGVAGFLLGQIEHSRTPTLIVEDYESTPNVARLDTSDSAFGDRHLLEEMVDRWHPRPEKRISILGFYRSCPQGQVSLNSDDLEISSAHPIEPERIFLLIEPQVGNASRGTLCMVRDGAIAWEWHSVSFNRKELAERGAACQSPISGLQGPSPQLQKVMVPEKQDSGQQPEKQLKASYRVCCGIRNRNHTGHCCCRNYSIAQHASVSCFVWYFPSVRGARGVRVEASAYRK